MNSAYATLLKNEFLAIASGIAAEMGVKVYFVGGGLRDMLTGREIKDMDFALDDRPEEIPAIFARRIEGTFFWLNEQRLQARVVKKSARKVMTFDFAPLRGCNIVEDLSLRDFTMNAFALPLTDGGSSILDPLNGIHDLHQGLIRVCSDVSFDHDPLRLLRALRFATIPGFSIESGTWRKICDKASLLQRVAPERIRAELFQILDSSDAGAAFGKLHESGLLPEIIPIRSVPEENGSPTIEKRLRNVIEIDKIMAKPDFYFPDAGEHLLGYLGIEVESGVTMGALVKLAIFLGVNGSSGTDAAATAEKLKLGCKARRVLEILCSKAGQMSTLPAWKPTERAIFRFFRDREPAGPGVLIIALAQRKLPAKNCAEMAAFYFTDYPNIEDISFLSGEEIMTILGTGPGRLVGEAMKLLRDAESAGLVNSKAEAMEYLNKNLLTKDGAVI